MSTGTDNTQKPFDLLKGAINPDGSFNRAPSSFRRTIEKGGQFEPEKGK